MTKVKKVYISYTQYGKLMDDLIEHIKSLDIKFTHVFGPAKGGLPLAVHIANEFDIPMILDLEFTEGVRPRQSKILIVDDICDSGKTMINITDSLFKRQVEYYTSTLFVKPRATYKPKFSVVLVRDWEWIVFPFEGGNDRPDKDYMLTPVTSSTATIN